MLLDFERRDDGAVSIMATCKSSLPEVRATHSEASAGYTCCGGRSHNAQSRPTCVRYVGHTALLRVLLSVSNLCVCVRARVSGQTLEPFACKFAVPPHLEISVSPPSGASLAGHGGAITQSLTLSRKAAGAAKPLKMRLLIEYKRNGRPVHDVVEFVDFPSDL